VYSVKQNKNATRWPSPPLCLAATWRGWPATRHCALRSVLHHVHGPVIAAGWPDNHQIKSKLRISSVITDPPLLRFTQAIAGSPSFPRLPRKHPDPELCWPFVRITALAMFYPGWFSPVAAKLFDKSRNVSRPTLDQDVFDPIKIHWPCVGARLAPDDNPVDSLQVAQINRAEQGFQA
jgi:hypothetical protein